MPSPSMPDDVTNLLGLAVEIFRHPATTPDIHRRWASKLVLIAIQMGATPEEIRLFDKATAPTHRFQPSVDPLRCIVCGWLDEDAVHIQTVDRTPTDRSKQASDARLRQDGIATR